VGKAIFSWRASDKITECNVLHTKPRFVSVLGTNFPFLFLFYSGVEFSTGDSVRAAAAPSSTGGGAAAASSSTRECRVGRSGEALLVDIFVFFSQIFSRNFFSLPSKVFLQQFASQIFAQFFSITFFSFLHLIFFLKLCLQLFSIFCLNLLFQNFIIFIILFLKTFSQKFMKLFTIALRNFSQMFVYKFLFPFLSHFSPFARHLQHRGAHEWDPTDSEKTRKGKALWSKIDRAEANYGLP
jgi:hypothetical protein